MSLDAGCQGCQWSSITVTTRLWSTLSSAYESGTRCLDGHGSQVFVCSKQGRCFGPCHPPAPIHLECSHQAQCPQRSTTALVRLPCGLEPMTALTASRAACARRAAAGTSDAMHMTLKKRWCVGPRKPPARGRPAALQSLLQEAPMLPSSAFGRKEGERNALARTPQQGNGRVEARPPPRAQTVPQTAQSACIVSWPHNTCPLSRAKQRMPSNDESVRGARGECLAESQP